MVKQNLTVVSPGTYYTICILADFPRCCSLTAFLKGLPRSLPRPPAAARGSLGLSRRPRLRHPRYRGDFPVFRLLRNFEFEPFFGNSSEVVPECVPHHHSCGRREIGEYLGRSHGVYLITKKARIITQEGQSWEIMGTRKW